MDEKAERDAFEAWAPTYHKLTSPGPLTRLDGNGRYFYGPVNASWAAWQARAALAAAPAPAPLTVGQVHELCNECGLDWHRGWSIDEEPNRYLRLARAIERAHGIGTGARAQAQKGE